MAASQMVVPTFDELMWPALKALKAMGGSGSSGETPAELQTGKDALPASLRQMEPSALERLAQRRLGEAGFMATDGVYFDLRARANRLDNSV
jgi:hypothetical protein